METVVVQQHQQVMCFNKRPPCGMSNYPAFKSCSLVVCPSEVLVMYLSGDRHNAVVQSRMLASFFPRVLLINCARWEYKRTYLHPRCRNTSGDQAEPHCLALRCFWVGESQGAGSALVPPHGTKSQALQLLT